MVCEVVDNVNRVSAGVRAGGGLVIFLQNTIDSLARADRPNWFHYFMKPERIDAMCEAFSPCAFGHELWPAGTGSHRVFFGLEESFLH